MRKVILSFSILSTMLISSNSFSEETAGAKYKYFSGNIDKLPIQLTIIKNNRTKDHNITGFYSYNSQGIKYLKLDGGYENDFEKDMGSVFLAEFDEKNNPSGSFDGIIKNNTFEGDWLPKGDGKKLNFKLNGTDYTKTLVKDLKTKKSLLNKTTISLQWLSFKDVEKIKSYEKNNKVFLSGKYKSKTQKDDFLEVDGFFTMIDKNQLNFNGKITMQIYHINSGMPCQRTGDFTFKKYNGRNYWRMQEMQNPCDSATDYVDISAN